MCARDATHNKRREKRKRISSRLRRGVRHTAKSIPKRMNEQNTKASNASINFEQCLPLLLILSTIFSLVLKNDVMRRNIDALQNGKHKLHCVTMW